MPEPQVTPVTRRSRDSRDRPEPSEAIDGSSDDDDRTPESLDTTQSRVEGEDRPAEHLGEGDVHRVPGSYVGAELPRAVEQRPMTEPLTRPPTEILHGLSSGGRIESTEQMLASHDAHDLDVDDLRRRMVGVGREALTEPFAERGVGNHLVETRGVNHEHPATAP